MDGRRVSCTARRKHGPAAVRHSSVSTFSKAGNFFVRNLEPVLYQCAKRASNRHNQLSQVQTISNAHDRRPMPVV